jgi:peptide/bleomycin uptake transporter
MLRSFFKDKKWMFWAYGGASLIIILLITQTWITVQFNAWYGTFYDLLQNPNEGGGIEKFYERIKFFLILAIPYVTIITFTNWFTRMWAFRWREAMTFAYMPYWKAIDAKVEGASQRIQEDCMNFARIVESIGLQIIRAFMLLIAFIPILWGLSSNVIIPWLKDINGSLVYVSLTASLGGVLISWLVGIKLPGLEYNNQVVEAAFRKELVYGEDDRIEYAKPPTILELFAGIKFNYHRLFLHYGYFDLWLIMYNQSMVIVPYIVMGPGLFTGAMTLGILIQTSSAFREVQGSFSLFMQNWTRITELRSIYRRLTEFEKAIGYKNPDRLSPDIVRS